MKNIFFIFLLILFSCDKLDRLEYSVPIISISEEYEFTDNGRYLTYKFKYLNNSKEQFKKIPAMSVEFIPIEYGINYLECWKKDSVIRYKYYHRK